MNGFKKILAAIALGILPAAAAFAQTAPPAPPSGDIASLYAWAQAQQKYLGTGMDTHGTIYAVTWWDAISLGSSGLNVGKAGATDLFDLGPGMSAANAKPTRYGQAFPVHIGNMWNWVATNLPESVGSHLNIAVLPSNLTVTALFLWPDHKALGQWRWDNDFQGAVAYRFGGN